jgi:NAD+ kinase
LSTPPSTRTVTKATVVTHNRHDETREAVDQLRELAQRIGVELLPQGDERARREADVCIVLGGDGATLRAMRAFADTDVPVFSINYGRVGFLATADQEHVREALELALTGRFEVAKMPALVLDEGSPEMFAINEVSFLRRSHLNVTHITYYLAGEVIARVPCDGLLAATPVGSTGYNLSVGGPILSWGVRAFVVSLVAAHALSARGLVASPTDLLEVVNEGPEPLDIVFDGIRLKELAVGARSEVRFRPDVVGLGQLPGESFYRRFREKLLQLSQ